MPGPELRGRKGFYGPEHLARLRLIHDLRERGFSLESIRHLIERDPEDSLEDAIEFTRALLVEPADEEPQRRLEPGLPRALGRPAHARARQARGEARLRPPRRRRRVGDPQPAARARVESRSASSASRSRTRSRSARSCSAARARSRAPTSSCSSSASGSRSRRPASPRRSGRSVRAALDRLRPLAGESLLAVFEMVMADAIEQAAQRIRNDRRLKRPRRARPRRRRRAHARAPGSCRATAAPWRGRSTAPCRAARGRASPRGRPGRAHDRARPACRCAPSQRQRLPTRRPTATSTRARARAGVRRGRPGRRSARAATRAGASPAAAAAGDRRPRRRRGARRPRGIWTAPGRQPPRVSPTSSAPLSCGSRDDRESSTG